MNNSYDPSAGGYGSAPAGTPAPAASARKKRLFRWGAGITLAGFLVGGGIAWAATSATGAPTASDSAGSDSAGSGPTGTAAVLNTALNAAGTSASTAGSTAPARRARWALGRLRLLGGVDGQFTFHNKTGFHTLAFERGTIQSVTGTGRWRYLAAAWSWALIARG